MVTVMLPNFKSEIKADQIMKSGSHCELLIELLIRFQKNKSEHTQYAGLKKASTVNNTRSVFLYCSCEKINLLIIIKCVVYGLAPRTGLPGGG